MISLYSTDQNMLILSWSSNYPNTICITNCQGETVTKIGIDNLEIREIKTSLYGEYLIYQAEPNINIVLNHILIKIA